MINIRLFLGTIFFSFLLILFYAFSESIAASLVLLLAGCLIFTSNIFFSNNFSPITLFSLGWVLPSAFVVFLNKNQRYINWQVHEIFWVTVILSTFGFIIGVLVTYLAVFQQLHRKGSLKELTKKIKFYSHNESINYDKVFIFRIIHVISFFGLIGFGNNLMNILGAGGFSIIGDLGLRDSEIIFGQSRIINYLYFLNPLAFALSISFLTRYGTNNRIRLIAIISFLTLFFHGTRSTIIYPFVISVISYLILRDSKIKVIQIIGGFTFILLSFQLITIGRNFPFIPADSSIIEILTYRIEDIFLYFTPGYSNLQMEIINFKHFRFGAESFQFVDGIINFLTGSKVVEEDIIFNSEQFYLVDESFNTGTFLRENYRDFGFWGVFFFSFYYGVLSSFFYFKLLIKPTIKNVVSYSIICLMLLFCFFSNQFFKIQNWYWIIVLFIMTSLCKKFFPTKFFSNKYYL